MVREHLKEVSHLEEVQEGLMEIRHHLMVKEYLK